MFVQATTSSRQNGKTYVSYLVRESFRTPNGPRSRTICNITDLPIQTRDLIVASLRGQDFLPADQVQLHEALDYGGLAVLNDAWSRFHLSELFTDIGSARQRRLLQAVIYSRLLFPCAKLSLAQQAQGTWLAEACGLEAQETFDEDDIYTAMDQLNGHWVNLEKQLYQRAFPQKVRLVLYDLTSVYFEGRGPEQRDQERRQSRIDKAEAELKRWAEVQRKKVDVQRLASQVGRSLQRLKAHKYFTYRVDAQGRLQWERQGELIAQEAQQDGWYLLHTNESVPQCPGEQVLGHYKATSAMVRV